MSGRDAKPPGIPGGFCFLRGWLSGWQCADHRACHGGYNGLNGQNGLGIKYKRALCSGIFVVHCTHKAMRQSSDLSDLSDIPRPAVCAFSVDFTLISLPENLNFEAVDAIFEEYIRLCRSHNMRSVKFVEAGTR